LVTQLRDAIRQSGKSLNAISKMCGVGSDRLSRFMRGERDLTLAAAERICLALHLKLAPYSPEPEAAPAEPSGEKRKGRKKE
jgi:transcriptional regulator with XRE-family HTH domain